MGIYIKKIHHITEDSCEASFQFAGEILHTIVYGKPEEMKNSLQKGQVIGVECHFKDFISYKRISDFDEKLSGIWQDGDEFLCRGQIKYKTPLDEINIFDVFIANGNMFITVMLGNHHELELETGIEMTVTGLEFYSIGI